MAFSKVFSEGEPSDDANNYCGIAVVGHYRNSDAYSETLPCGYCREFMSEFVNKDFFIITCDNEGGIHEYTLADLLPNAFDFQKGKRDF